MKSFLNNLKSQKFLIPILVLAFAVRIYGIAWGLPESSSVWPVGGLHPDEGKFIIGASQFPIHILTNTDFRYPTGGHYILGLLTLPIRLIILFINGTDGVREFFPSMFIIGRFFSALAGTLSILITYCLSIELFKDKKAAIFSSLFLTLSVYHVTDSAFSTSDVAQSLFLPLFILFSIRSIKYNKSSLYVISGITLGLLTGVKYSGFTGLLFFPIYYLISEINKNGLKTIGFKKQIIILFRSRNTYLFFGSFLLIFLITTPGILLHPSNFIGSIDFEVNRLNSLKHTVSWLSPKKYYLLLSTIIECVGLPLFLASVPGIIISIRKKNNFSNSIAFLTLFYIINVVSAFFPRYVITIAPFLSIYAGLSISFLFQKQLKSIKPIAMIIMIILFGLSTINIYSSLWQRYPDTRNLAVDWINNNIPPEKTISYAYPSLEEGNGAGPGGLKHLWRYPISQSIIEKYKLVDFLESPDYLIVNSYDTNYISKILSSGLVDIENGYKINKIPKNKKMLFYSSFIPQPNILKFYAGLENSNFGGYKLETKFEPKSNIASIKLGHPAPFIWIYKKQ